MGQMPATILHWPDLIRPLIYTRLGPTYVLYYGLSSMSFQKGDELFLVCSYTIVNLDINFQ
jgi:hypothetical protein